MAKTPTPSADKRTKENLWVTLPAGGRSGRAPGLSLAGCGLSAAEAARARRLWSRLWAMPVATMWSEVVDAPGLTRLVVLSVAEGAPASVLPEIRQLEDRFGLSPKARRQLFWRIEGVDVPSVEAKDLGHEVGRSVPSAGGEGDPRLRVVDGGKAAG